MARGAMLAAKNGQYPFTLTSLPLCMRAPPAALPTPRTTCGLSQEPSCHAPTDSNTSGRQQIMKCHYPVGIRLGT
eukprot:6460671-Amphidinium_carterae.1